jgi:RNA polymerase sigma-70 factor (ECF subfamily)
VESGRSTVDSESPAADGALIEAALVQPEAFGLLYQRYMPRVYRYVSTLTASSDEAADVTQQTFIKAMSALSTYRAGRASFSAWLLRIARNAAFDAHRRRRPSVRWDTLAGLVVEAGCESPEALVLKQERLTRLRALVQELDPAKRELLALRFAAGLTSREIGAVVGKSEGAVKKQLFRIIASLKEHYLEEPN